MPPLVIRLILSAILILGLSVAGSGQGFASRPDRLDTIEVVPGQHTPICHDGPTAAPDTGKGGTPSGHDCCDVCALLAPAVLPASPGLTGPSAVMRFASHARAVPWTPSVARARSPRQSQGPPAA